MVAPPLAASVVVGGGCLLALGPCCACGWRCFAPFPRPPPGLAVDVRGPEGSSDPKHGGSIAGTPWGRFPAG